MKKVLFLALAAASFSVASCDSKKQEAVNKEADAVKASGNAQAAKMEASADSTKKAASANANAIKEEKK